MSTSADDGLKLIGARITNAVRCVPPANKPLPGEVRNCADYLVGDLQEVADGGVVIALGRISHEAILAALGLRAPRACAPTTPLGEALRAMQAAAVGSMMTWSTFSPAN